MLNVLPRRNRQRIIIGIIIALIVVVIGYFVYQDYSSKKPSYPIGTLDETPPAPSANAVTTASGLVYEDLQVGDGTAAQSGNTVSVNYTGWLEDGTKFDSSLDRGQPFEFTLGAGEVIAGWDEGVTGMIENGTRLLSYSPRIGLWCFRFRINHPTQCHSDF